MSSHLIARARGWAVMGAGPLVRAWLGVAMVRCTASVAMRVAA